MSEQLSVNDSLDALEEVEQGAEQFLAFQLAGEEYAVDILSVQEIKGWDRVTQVPNAPEYMRGVLNLRGEIVPVVDLRLRFGMTFKPYTNTTVVVVLKVGNGIQRTVGIVVDAVSDAHNIKPEMIKTAPEMGREIDTSFIQGLVDIDDKMVMLLNIDELLSTESIG